MTSVATYFFHRFYFKKYILRILLLLSFSLFIVSLKSQQYLQIESKAEDNIKISINEKIKIKTLENEDWHEIKLEKFLYEDSLILHENGYIKLNEITHIRRNRGIAGVMGDRLMQLGGAWIVYGFLGSLANEDTPFTSGQLITGGVAIGIGYLFKKVLYKRDFKIGKRYRLRLLDLRLE